MKVEYYNPSMPPWKGVEKKLEDAYRRGWLVHGDYSKQLQDKMEKYLDAKYVYLTSTCSDALLLMMSDLPKGSKVIIPSYTFRTAYHSPIWNDLIPVCVDVTENGTMSPDELAHALREHEDVSAVLLVHLWGNVEHVEAIEFVCKRHKVRLIVDAATCMGTKYKRKPVGVQGDVTVYSLGITKPLSCCEGGMVATNDPHIAELAKLGRWYGNDYGRLDSKMKGLNARANEFSSILALEGLKHLESQTERRREIAAIYDGVFCSSPLDIKRQTIGDGCQSSRSNYSIWVRDEETRDSLVKFLAENEIETRQYFPAINLFSCFNGLKRTTKVSERKAKTVITLPCYANMTDAQAKYVCKKVEEYFNA